MKLPLLLASMALAASATARDAPPVWPRPSPLPVIPEGANPAAYPASTLAGLLLGAGLLRRRH